jgi:hypothetical protein
MNRLVLAFAALMSFDAAACGVCIDDKIASCYDHAVVTRAHAQGHAVVFFAIRGDLVRSAETRRAIIRAIEATGGVQRGTARVSLENAALSFAFDPARTSLMRAHGELARKLSESRLDLTPLRVLKGPPT